MKIAIVGRTNVGKSTLFNKIIGKKQALTSDISGTTRDINKGETEWTNTKFTVYDTAGLGEDTVGEIEKKVEKQSMKRLKNSDLILLLLDGQEELLPQDKEIMKILRKTKTPIILAVNKVDSPNIRKKINVFNFEKLGFGEPTLISSTSGSGVGDLLDNIVEQLNSMKLSGKIKDVETAKKEDKKLPEINAILVGKPNAGKSSMVNAVIKRKVHIKEQEEIIVTNIPHTTREPQERPVKTEKYKINFIDTAGIRKKAKVDKAGLEISSVKKSISTLNEGDVILFIVDISTRLTSQDKKLAGLIEKNKNGLIIVGNKWDLVKGKTITSDQEFIEYLRKSLPHLRWAPIIFTSATTGKNVSKLLDLIEGIHEQRNKEISEEDLNDFIKEIVKVHRPVKAKGPKHPKIYNLKQTGASPPQFTLTIGPKDNMHFSYIRFIENKIRERFGFEGTLIDLRIRNRK